MFTRSRAGLWLARSLLLCALPLLMTGPGLAEDRLAWREAQDSTQLIAHLDDWIDAHTDLPRRPSPPELRLISRTALPALDSALAAHLHTVRGVYDAESATIYLVRPFSSRDPRDVSVLLHELIHHRQAAAGHWYCPGAQELPAYRAQQAWLAELGLELDVNWIAIVLEAGCAPRGIHPD